MSFKQKELFGALTQETGVKELQEYFRKIFELRGFKKEQTTDKIIMLIEEVGELAKAIRKERSKLAIDYNRINEYESIEGEIADVFIVLISICVNENINLMEAVLRKRGNKYKEEMGEIMKCLSRKQMYYLLWVTIMNQSQSALTVIYNAEELLKRLGDDEFYNEIGYKQINHCFNTLPKLHRFPNKMAKNIYNSILTVKDVFDSDISKVFSGGEKHIIDNLLKFKGISCHKANLCMYILKCMENRSICSEKIRKECNCNITDEILFKELLIIENLL